MGQVVICSDNGEISRHKSVALDIPELTSSDFRKTFEYFNQSLTIGLANDITDIGLTATWTILVKSEQTSIEYFTDGYFRVHVPGGNSPCLQKSVSHCYSSKRSF